MVMLTFLLRAVEEKHICCRPKVQLPYLFICQGKCNVGASQTVLLSSQIFMLMTECKMVYTSM